MSATPVIFTGTVDATSGAALLRLDRDNATSQAILRSNDRELKALDGKRVRVTVEVIP
jgi:hypothetical protein